MIFPHLLGVAEACPTIRFPAALVGVPGLLSLPAVPNPKHFGGFNTETMVFNCKIGSVTSMIVSLGIGIDFRMK